MNEIASVSVWRIIRLASDEVVGNDQRLARTEIARVVEGNGTQWRYRLALSLQLAHCTKLTTGAAS
jgi:hypothetical protein